MVQYGCVQALGLLLRSNPNKWWPSISPIFNQILANANHANIVKCSVISTYGKVAYYIKPENPYFSVLKQILVTLSIEHDPNSDVTMAALSALTSFSLAHQFMYQEVKRMISDKIGGTIISATQEALTHYLKIWCRLLSKDYFPVLNLTTSHITHQPDPEHVSLPQNSVEKTNLRNLPSKKQGTRWDSFIRYSY